MPIKKKKNYKRKKKSIQFKIPKKNSKHDEDSITCHSSRLVPDQQHITCKKEALRDKGGVLRIYSPFNRFASNNSRVNDKAKSCKVNFGSTYPDTGLSSKEKSYVICSCQSRFTRYVKLKYIAAKAIKENKIFTIYGSCNAVRKALLERGWVEKIPPNRMNLSKIRNGTYSNKVDIHNELESLLLSNLVEKYNPNFVWRSKEEHRDTTIDMNKDCSTIVNKLKIDAVWTTKQGLCYSMKQNYWHYIENVAEVNGPRTYNSYDAGEIEEFVKDYRITACTSLLKWVLSMVANKRPVFIESGKISLNTIVFALNRSKEYLFRNQNYDIDTSLNSVSNGQWNAFLSKYYRIISKDDVFEEDVDNKLPLYLSYAKFLLKEIHRYRPQLSCEGCHNIWIIKPAHCSRGRGIRMASKLGVITNLLNKANSKYVVQKYIEEPLLIHETKFDIRQYYLVTSTYPLVIWMYTDCYLKFSSQKYNLKNYHESIHLTNNAVQRKYLNCTGRHSELPQNNMWDLDRYKDYLNQIGKNKAWDNIIYPGMKKSIIGIMLSCQDSLSVSKNRFELYGCDFILDREYNTWLIEINSCPDLNHTTQVTAKICPAVVSDIIKVVIDYANNPNACTGKFECIYRQPLTTPKFGGSDLFVRGYSLPLEYFYKGNIEIMETYADPDIGKECDVKGVLDKLKRFYESDIMKEPEDNEKPPMRRQCSKIRHAKTSEDFSMESVIISEQMEELMDTISKECSFSSKTNNDIEPLSPTKSLDFVRSLTDVRTLIKNPHNKVASLEIINADQKFYFSHLDDGPSGNGSFGVLDIVDRFSQILSSSRKEDPACSFVNKRNNVNVSGTNENVLQATSKIISFITEKEKEYKSELQSIVNKR